MPGEAAAGRAPTTDGRVLRAERTRRSVVEALLDLIGEGEIHPTARQVSDRSGVSMRSIFRLFEDVEALHSEGISVQMARVAPLFAAPQASGPLSERAESLVAQRSRLYETISPVRRLAIRLAARSTPIAKQLARSNTVLRNQLSTQFAPELADLRPGPRDETIEALDAVTSWEAWERLRTGQHLDAEAAARITTALVLALLG